MRRLLVGPEGPPLSILVSHRLSFTSEVSDQTWGDVGEKLEETLESLETAKGNHKETVFVSKLKS